MRLTAKLLKRALSELMVQFESAKATIDAQLQLDHLSDYVSQDYGEPNVCAKYFLGRDCTMTMAVTGTGSCMFHIQNPNGRVVSSQAFPVGQLAAHMRTLDSIITKVLSETGNYAQDNSRRDDRDFLQSCGIKGRKG
jgi:hypothetical protein